MGSSLLRILRYIVFGLFISCSAIVASIAVWNHSLAQTAGWDPQIDIYLIFLGCLGLAHIFTIIFIELVFRHCMTGRVWFECLWFGVFWLMYLAGASAATALLPANLCDFQKLSNDACTSSRLLLVFLWFMTGILLFYFLFLFTASLLQFPHDSRIFQSYVHKFPWGEIGHSMSNPPSPPSLPKVFKKMPSIIAPKPQHPPPVALYNHRAGLSSAYEIEGYATPEPTDAPLPAFTPPPALLTMMHKPLDPYDETFEPLPQSYTAPAFYPHQVQAAIAPVSARSEPHVLAQPVRSMSTQRPHRVHQASASEPAPLGNWPRRSVLASPRAKARRKPPPPSTGPEPIRPLPVLPTTTTSPLSSVSPPVASTSSVAHEAAATATAPRISSSPPRARPSGPRRRSDAEARANMPELTSGHKATSYQSGT